jgi:hypothetical protein
MSIWSDQAVKELQEKVAWLEREVTELRLLVTPLEKPQPVAVNGTLHVKRK